MVDAKVTVTPAVMQTKIPKTYLEYERYDSTAYQVTATYNGKVLTERVTVDLSNKTAVEKSEYLYESGRISESEHIRVLCEQLTSGDDWDGGAQCYGTTLVAEITAYAETMSEDDPNYEIIAATADSLNQGPEYVEEYVYRQGSNTFFRIHYGTMLNQNGVEVSAGTLQDAINLNSRLEHIKLFFCSQMGLKVPIGHIDSGVYDVYIVYDDYLPDAYATATPVGSEGESYITVRERAASQSSDDIPSGVIAHEFSHASMYVYQVLASKVSTIANASDVSWMHESFASFFGCLYTLGRTYANYSAFETAYFEGNGFNVTDEETYINAIAASRVKKYLKSMYLSLNEVPTSGTYVNRHYGAMLFPLYLYETDGGIAMIKRILVYYAYYYHPLFTIDNHGLSFEDSFDDYSKWVFTPTQNSKINASSWGMAEPYAPISNYPYSLPRTNAPSLSCTWRKFIPPDNSAYTLTVTTSIYGLNSSTAASLLTKYPTSSGSYVGGNSTMSTGQIVSSRAGFGTVCSEFWVGFVNRSMDSTCTYYQTATIKATSTASYTNPIIEITSPLAYLGIVEED